MTVLVVSNSEDPTADYVQERMDEEGVDHLRFNTDKVLLDMKHTFDGDSTHLCLDDREVSLEEVVGIWYRRPETPEAPDFLSSEQAREHVEVEAYYYLKCLWRLLEDRNWVSHPWAISWANVKLHQLTKARSLGLSVPKSLATNDPREAQDFIEGLDGKVVVKPFKNNVLTYEGQTAVIYTSRVSEEFLQNLESVGYSITFFQEEIKKVVDVRVTVIGQKVFAAETPSQLNPNTALDWRRNSPEPKRWELHNLPEEIAKRCLALKAEYGLSFAAIDFAKTPEGEYVFFELNPNGQWAWLEIELGLPMTNALIDVLTKGE